MSPEQIAADPTGLDGRSDVYTLGVILFELLAHRLPYQLDQLPVHEVARVIQQQEPSRLGSIDTLYRGDVEIIVAKALEKDKTQRYASAGDLASDIRRDPARGSDPGPASSALYQLTQIRPATQGDGGEPGRHLRGALGGNSRFDFLCRVRRAAENARVASERTDAPPPTRATGPGSRPRWPRSRVTTLPMPPASSTRPRRLCRGGNGNICTPGSTTARPSFARPLASRYSSPISAKTSGSQH